MEHGRRRPKAGPLTEALDRFVAGKIKDVAHQINAGRQERLDERALDEVHEENRKLDEFKNRFLPEGADASSFRAEGAATSLIVISAGDLV